MGKEIAATKREDFDVVALGHKELDVTSPASIEAALKKYQPEAIINCAVIISIDKCEADPQQCFAINRDGVKNLLEASVKLGRPLTFVQISSSEVFGRVGEGEYKIEGYTEDEEPQPVNNYQKSKAEAEKLVQEYSQKYPQIFKRWIVARAAWLYGQGRATFVEQFLEGLQKEGELTVISDQWRSPTWAGNFVAGLFDLLESSAPSGFYHVVEEVKLGEATTVQVVEEIIKFLGKDKVKAKLKEVKREDFFKIKRAPSNILLNTKLPKLPYWRKSLKKYLESLSKTRRLDDEF